MVNVKTEAEKSYGEVLVCVESNSRELNKMAIICGIAERFIEKIEGE